MSLHPNVEEQAALAETFSREGARMPRRELASEVAVGVGFVVITTALWALRPPHGFPVVAALLCMGVLVAATLVHIDTPFGFAPPTQLAFVPLLFAIPLSTVPIAVAVALALSRLPAALRREAPAVRLLLCAGNSWFALGPVAVFVVAGVRPVMAGPLLLVAALLAQFVLDFGIYALRLALCRGVNPMAQLGGAWVYGVDAGLSGVAYLVAKNMGAEPASVLALLPLLAIFAMFARERHHRLEGLLELNSAYRGTALVLGDVVEADDGYTGEHCKSVVELALTVAKRMNLSAAARRNLEFAALLHDVGKIAIPKDIINKPGSLDPEEWSVIKTHTIEGQKMLDRVGGFMRDVGLIVRSHHERWDGSGYPDGLAGEDIPLEARIIACCDAWNAMRTDRAYRKAVSYEVAMAELMGNVGSQFDPRIADVLVEIVAPEAEAEVAREAGALPAPHPPARQASATVATAVER